MNNRTNWVDYAKAIGIILVVYGHVARGINNAGMELSPEFFKFSDSIVYSFHMPLFFFLSGLFFYNSLSKSGGVGLTLRKVDSIVYPYLIWSLLQGTIEATLSNYTNGNVTFSEILTIWEPRAQFWFLYALFFVFIASAIISYFLPERFVGLVFIIAIILYLNTSLTYGVKPFLYIANNLVFFVFGMLFTKKNIKTHLSSNRALMILFAAFVCLQYFFHFYLGKLYTYVGIESLLVALVSILFIVSLSIF